MNNDAVQNYDDMSQNKLAELKMSLEDSLIDAKNELSRFLDIADQFKFTKEEAIVLQNALKLTKEGLSLTELQKILLHKREKHVEVNNSLEDLKQLIESLQRDLGDVIKSMEGWKQFSDDSFQRFFDESGDEDFVIES